MASQYPGYLGYEIIENTEMQTGVHCGDIAIHMQDLRRNQDTFKSLFHSYNQGPNVEKTNAKKILNAVLQSKRRELCEFAINKIKNNDEISKKSMADEIISVLVEYFYFVPGPDANLETIYSNILTDEVGQGETNPFNILPSFTELLMLKLGSNTINNVEDLTKDPALLEAYINDYYLTGNNVGDNPLDARMFNVPQPGRHGMMDLAAMQLNNKIIVISARNGLPYESYDFRNDTRTPRYVGYTGRSHYVELRPYNTQELYTIFQQQPKNDDEKIEQAIIRGRLVLSLGQNDEDDAIKNLVNETTSKYANLVENRAALEGMKTQFANLKKIDTTTPEGIHKLSKMIENKERSIAANAIEIASSIQAINELPLDGLQTALNKAVSEPNNDFDNDRGNWEVYSKPSQPSPRPTLFERFKSIVAGFVAIILYPFKWLAEVLIGSATPVPAKANVYDMLETEEDDLLANQFKIVTIQNLSGDTKSLLEALIQQLQTHFIKLASQTNDPAKINGIVSQWDSMMHSIQEKNYLGFCNQVSSFIKDETVQSANPTTGQELLRHYELVRDDTPDIQMTVAALETQIRNQPPKLKSQ